QSGGRLELRRVDGAGALGVEQLPGTIDRTRVDAGEARRSTAALLGGHQAFGEVDDEAVHRERLQGLVERPGDRVRQRVVGQHGLPYEWQLRRGPAYHTYSVPEASRLHVDDPVAESVARARPSVVRLVGIERDALSRGAGPRRPAAAGLSH